MQNNKYYLELDKSNKRYKNFIQFATKKGKKHTIENKVRKALFHTSKKHNYFWHTIDKAIDNTTIYLNVKIKRQGSKNIYIPTRIKKNYRNFLAYNWILSNIKKNSKTPFYKAFIHEIIETAENKSASSKKKNEIYKLIEENINNIWKK